MKYECIKDFEVGRYDEDGRSAESNIKIKAGSVWEVDEKANILGGEIHIKNRENLEWLELSREALKKLFRKTYEDMEECRAALLEAFPGSFINKNDEFIAHPRTNQYFILKDCSTPEDIKCKVLEWLSRPAFKTQPYSQEWRNRKFHEFMLNGINNFLDTSFTEEQIAVIYEHLGNAIRHKKTIEFVSNSYNLDVLNE